MRVKKSEAVFLSLSFIIWTVLIALIGSCSHTNSSRGNFNRPQELDTYFSKQALSRAKTLSRAGEMAASKQELFDLLKRYPNTQAAEDAAILLIDWMVSENEIVKAKDFAWEFLIFHNKSDYTSRVRDRISKLDSVDQVKPDEKIDYWALLAASKEREKETLSFAEIEKSKQVNFMRMRQGT